MASVSVGQVGFSPGEAAALAERLGLPLGSSATSPPAGPFQAWLARDPGGRLVLECDDGGSPIRVHTPRRVDRDEALLRALGVGRGVRTVVDATAGLGRDGLRAALGGCDVTLVERESWLVALLEDGVEALGLPPSRLRVVHGDAFAWLDEASKLPVDSRPDTVLLDPMFDPLGRGKSALPKRDLQVLRRLCTHPAEGELGRLVAAARRVATRRVVLKRRPNASRTNVGGDKPIAEVRGRLARYDVYGPKVDATNPDRA